MTARLASGLGLGLLFFATAAHAAPVPTPTTAPTLAPRQVWIDARPWTCIHEASALARDAELACDALGGHCQVATSEAVATHRAILTCDPSAARWTLRIETIASEPMVTVTLTGDHEERLRKAAMWIARADDSGPAEGPPPAAAPPAPVTAPATAARSLAPPPEPRRWVLPVDADTKGWEVDAPAAVAPPKPRAPRRGGLALDATFGVTNSQYFDSFHGLHASIAFPVGPFHIGPVGTYEQASITGSGFSNGSQVASIGRVGARAGWGAPFSNRVIGFWIESGVAVGTRHAGPVGFHHTNASWGPDVAPNDFVTPYGHAEIMLQVPFDAPVRPYIAVAGVAALNEFGESVQSAQASAGLVWRAW